MFLFIDNVSGNVGLAITQIFFLSSLSKWGMGQTAELENQMTSVERVAEYTNIKSEPSLESSKENSLPNSWPSHGKIIFTDLALRYCENSNRVLKGLTFTIKPNEKIGVVGRTGAGKSSIVQALFRLAHNEGSIEIDDVDISKLGLHDLRRKISIIPQDPILFSGTMRENLDPFSEKTDDELWSALEQVNK